MKLSRVFGAGTRLLTTNYRTMYIAAAIQTVTALPACGGATKRLADKQWQSRHCPNRRFYLLDDDHWGIGSSQKGLFPKQ